MRQFSTDVQAALNQDYVEYFFIVEMNLKDNYYMTTHSTDLTITENGVDTNYLADGAIVSYDTPSKNSVLDREAYQISFIDPAHDLLDEAISGMVGKDIKIRAGFIHDTLGPLVAPSDLVFVYKGFIDKPTINNDFESKIMSIECSSPMADLDSVKPYFTTDYGVKQYDSGDTCFDRISDGYSLQVKWGKT